MKRELAGTLSSAAAVPVYCIVHCEVPIDAGRSEGEQIILCAPARTFAVQICSR